MILYTFNASRSTCARQLRILLQSPERVFAASFSLSLLIFFQWYYRNIIKISSLPISADISLFTSLIKNVETVCGFHSCPRIFTAARISSSAGGFPPSGKVPHILPLHTMTLLPYPLPPSLICIICKVLHHWLAKVCQISICILPAGFHPALPAHRPFHPLKPYMPYISDHEHKIAPYTPDQ